MAKLTGQFIVAETLRGNGTEQNPYRLIAELWTTDGLLLADKDPHTGQCRFFPELIDKRSTS